MIVVFDANVWLAELGLRSGAGSAVCFYLNHHGARLAIPEVVRLEVEHNLRERLLEHVDRIRTNYSQLLTAFGKLREVVLPTHEEVETKVKEVFSSLDVEKVEIPFSLESARSSFLKTIRKEAPSDRKQQFKDGVIWADCLELLGEDAVILITNDRAFFEGYQYENGLARNLRLEAEERPHEFTIHPSLTDLLDALHTDVPFDEDELADEFFREHQKTIERILDSHSFHLTRRRDVRRTLFATEDPSTLFVDFAMTYECEDTSGGERTDGVLRLSGDGLFHPSSGEFSNLRNFGEHLQYRLADGTEKEQKNHVIFADSLVIGHREVTHSVRYELPESDRRGGDE